MNIVLDVAFIVSVAAFLKEQLGITGKIVLLYVFIIALFVGIVPLVSQAFPIAAPYIDVILKVVVLFLSAAGSWDAARQLMAKKTK